MKTFQTGRQRLAPQEGIYTMGSAGSLPSEMLGAGAAGTGVALILFVVAQVRHQERQAHAAAMAEVRALQARMNPHFSCLTR